MSSRAARERKHFVFSAHTQKDDSNGATKVSPSGRRRREENQNEFSQQTEKFRTVKRLPPASPQEASPFTGEKSF